MSQLSYPCNIIETLKVSIKERVFSLKFDQPINTIDWKNILTLRIQSSNIGYIGDMIHSRPLIIYYHYCFYGLHTIIQIRNKPIKKQKSAKKIS